MTDYSSAREWPRGTTEYLSLDVTANVSLSTQDVAVTFDRETFHDAEWQGSAGTTRVCRLLVDDDVLPEGYGVVPIYVRVTDSPEIPLIQSGYLSIV